jgi:methyl-accepting chemotaxis protein
VKLPSWAKLETIRAQMVLGLALLVLAVAISALFGVVALRIMSGDINRQLGSLREASRINAALQSGVLAEITAAEGYLGTGDSTLRARFARAGLETHALRRQYGRLQQLTADDRVLVDSMGRHQAMLETHYAMAHALLDLGRGDEARAMAEAARLPANLIADGVRELSAREASRAEAASQELERRARRRQAFLLGLLGLSTTAGVLLATITLRAVQAPLGRLIGAAERLGEGDLRPTATGRMADEFATLAQAFAAMSERLRGIVGEVVTESERIASSAGDLSAISEQLAASSGQISTSMVEISSGAETQAARLAEAGQAAAELREAAKANVEASKRVEHLGESIKTVALRHRQDVQGALTALLEVRGVVQASSSEVAALARSSEAIDEFVTLVKRIASQTNLLALNAAIEAARAGEHGRGFAVVAEEVRKLADESAAAAERVGETLAFIRSQVDRVTRTMQDGVGTVQGVEVVSQAAARGLEEIVSAVTGTLEASRRVAQAAAVNERAAQEIQELSGGVAAQASKHASAAESVTAAAEEQSASTQQMAAAASELLSAAERLRKVVSGFRV